MFSGEKISSEDAEKIGMIYKSVEDEMDMKLLLILQKNFHNANQIYWLIKTLINKSYENNLARSIDLEKELQTIAAQQETIKKVLVLF